MTIALADTVAIFLLFSAIVLTLEGAGGGSKVFSSRLLLGSRATSVLCVSVSPPCISPGIMPGTEFPTELVD